MDFHLPGALGAERRGEGRPRSAEKRPMPGWWGRRRVGVNLGDDRYAASSTSMMMPAGRHGSTGLRTVRANGAWARRVLVLLGEPADCDNRDRAGLLVDLLQ
jgi:hypothetical protein